MPPRTPADIGLPRKREVPPRGMLAVLAAEFTISFAGDVHFAGRVARRLEHPASAFGQAAPGLRVARIMTEWRHDVGCTNLSAKPPNP